MTPSVTRLVAGQYAQMSKPIRLFSIANFYRNEKPQRGRNREFWQLNADIFGVENLLADREILQLWLEIMKAFDVPDGSFELRVNHRILIDDFLRDICWLSVELMQETTRTMDKRDKLSEDDFSATLQKKWLKRWQIDAIVVLLKTNDLTALMSAYPWLADSVGMKELTSLMWSLSALWYGWYVKFSPRLMRWFDYYDGMIFEVFDLHPDNNRAMFGGGRYNGLAWIFGMDPFPSVGFAPGDETMRLFLESRNLVEKIRDQVKSDVYFIPLLDEKFDGICQTLAFDLRGEWKMVELWLSVKKLGKAIEYANKKWVSHVVIVGEEEVNAWWYKIKDMKSGDERVVSLNM